MLLLAGAVRTPFGSFLGSLSSLRSTELGSLAIKGALDSSGVSPRDVQEVYMGNVCAAGVGQAPARQAAIGAGLPDSIPCSTINKVCASGMKAIMMAAQSIMCGSQDIMIAGGQESMSNIPYYLKREPLKYGANTIVDGILLDGLTDAYTDLHMGDCAELTIEKYGITRKEQDDYALASYTKSRLAWQSGVYDNEVIPVTIPAKKKGQQPVTVSIDEEISKLDVGKLSEMRTLFNGSITFGNSSKINDGAAAMVLMSEQAASLHNTKPLARIVSFSDAADDPVQWSTAPALAIPHGTKKIWINIR